MQTPVLSYPVLVSEEFVTVLLLAVVMLVISPSRRQLGRLAVLSLKPLKALAVSAVGRGHRTDRVLHLPHLDLGLALDAPGLLGPPRHRAGLGGQVDRRRLVSARVSRLDLGARLALTSAHLRASTAGLSLQTGGGLLSRLAALFTQREKLLNSVWTGRS